MGGFGKSENRFSLSLESARCLASTTNTLTVIVNWVQIGLPICCALHCTRSEFWDWDHSALRKKLLLGSDQTLKKPPLHAQFTKSLQNKIRNITALQSTVILIVAAFIAQNFWDHSWIELRKKLLLGSDQTLKKNTAARSVYNVAAE